MDPNSSPGDLNEQTPPPASQKPSGALLFSAFAGLLGLSAAAVACTPAEEPPAQAAADMSVTDPTPPPDAATPPPGDLSYNRKISDKPLTFTEFSTLCEQRGGFVQTTATCSGNNSCKGLSYLDGVTTEHSCKGLNNCGPGMSCVDLQKDSGLSGKDVYEKGACAPTCHAQFGPFDASVFTLYVRPGGLTPAQAEARFKTGSRLRLLSIIAFGSHGVNDDGTAYANMPAFYSKYSRAEIERVVDHIRTLKVKTKQYEIVGP